GVDGAVDLLDEQHPVAVQSRRRIPRPAHPARGPVRRRADVPLGPPGGRSVPGGGMARRGRVAVPAAWLAVSAADPVVCLSRLLVSPKRRSLHRLPLTAFAPSFTILCVGHSPRRITSPCTALFS